MSNDTNKVQTPAITVASEAWECRTRELEARRLLAMLDHACVNEMVCEEKSSKLAMTLFPTKWKLCPLEPSEVIDYLVTNRVKWATSGFTIIIEGGNHERERRRIMDFLLYQSILARFRSYSHIARIYDWPAINGDLCRYDYPERPILIDGMTRIGVLGLNEFDLLSAPSKKNDVGAILTSILRKRKIGGRPTIITMGKPSWEAFSKVGQTGFGEYIESMFHMPHDDEFDKIIRIRVQGGPEGWEKDN